MTSYDLSNGSFLTLMGEITISIGEMTIIMGGSYFYFTFFTFIDA